MIKRVLLNEKVRFILVGVFNTALDFLLLNLFVVLAGFAPLLANTLSVTLCIMASYVLNHYFVFRSTERMSLRKFVAFFAVSGFSALLLQNIVIGAFAWAVTALASTSTMVGFLAEHTQIQLNLAKVLAVGVGMVWNFVAYKYIIFKGKTNSIVELEEKAEDGQ